MRKEGSLLEGKGSGYALGSLGCLGLEQKRRHQVRLRLL